MIFSRMPGKYKFCAVAVRTEVALKPYPFVNMFLVGIKRFLRAQFLMTNITAKLDSAVYIFCVFLQGGLRRELLIAIRTNVPNFLMVSLDVMS